MNRTHIIVLWAVFAAVLFVLISPITPGVAAPQGGKLLKPFLALALVAHVLAYLLSILLRTSLVLMQYVGASPETFRIVPLSLRC